VLLLLLARLALQRRPVLGAQQAQQGNRGIVLRSLLVGSLDSGRLPERTCDATRRRDGLTRQRRRLANRLEGEARLSSAVLHELHQGGSRVLSWHEPLAQLLWRRLWRPSTGTLEWRLWLQQRLQRRWELRFELCVLRSGRGVVGSRSTVHRSRQGGMLTKHEADEIATCRIGQHGEAVAVEAADHGDEAVGAGEALAAELVRLDHARSPKKEAVLGQ